MEKDSNKLICSDRFSSCEKFVMAEDSVKAEQQLVLAMI